MIVLSQTVYACLLGHAQGLWSAVLQQSSSTGGAQGAAVPAPVIPCAQQPAASQGAAGAAGAAAAGSAAVPTAAGAPDASPTKSPDQLLVQLKDSWLVKKLLQQQVPESTSEPGAHWCAVNPDTQAVSGALCVDKRGCIES